MKKDISIITTRECPVSTGRRQGGRLLSIKSLQRNYDTREFLRLAGYKQAPDQELEREIQTVGPEQAESIKSKIESFKITEDWAKQEKKKAIRELQNTVDETEKQKLQEKNTGIRSIGNSG